MKCFFRDAELFSNLIKMCGEFVVGGGEVLVVCGEFVVGDQELGVSVRELFVGETEDGEVLA